MISLPPNIKDIFFKTLQGEIPIEEFEQWLYSNKEIEQLLTPDDYLELISLNYKKSGARHELRKMLELQIDLGEFETYKMLNLLNEAALKNERFTYVLMQFYDLYCHGYYFLQNLGVVYGLSVLDPMALDNAVDEQWKDLTSIEREKLIQRLMPGIDAEIEKVKMLLIDKEIVLTGEQDKDFNRLQYLDNRTDEEKSQLQ